MEQSEIEIERALDKHGNGDMSIEEVQRVSNASVNLKYREEEASQAYKGHIERVNRKITECETVYKPLLEGLQQNEEKRISFVRFTFEKFAKYFE